MSDTLQLILAAITIIGALGGLQRYLHGIRTKTIADDRRIIEEDRRDIKSKLNKLDSDIDGLVKQMGADALDHERRYVTKEDHGRELRDIKQSLVEFGRKLEARFYPRREEP